MATLKEKLEAIKLDKDTNLLPEHLKAGVTCLGVEGKFEGVSKEIPVKLFSSEEEMQADTAAKQDDLAIVYKNELGILEVGQTYDSLYLPKTITLDTAITATTNIFFSTGTIMTATHFVRLTKTAINFYKKSGFSGAVVNTVAYTSLDGITYTRTDSLGEILTVEEIYSGEYTTITVQEANASLLQQMFLVKKTYFGGLYSYRELTYDGIYCVPINNLTLGADNKFVWDKTYNTDYLVSTNKFQNFINKCMEYCEENNKPAITGGKDFAFMYQGKLTTLMYTKNSSTPYTVFGYHITYDLTTARWWLSASIVLSSIDTSTVTLLQYDEDTDSLIATPIDVVTTVEEDSAYMDIIPETIISYPGDIKGSGYYIITNNAGESIYSRYDDLGIDCKYYYMGYGNASTQLNATSDYVFKKEFYGRKGIGKGTLQNNTNITKEEIVIKAELWDALSGLTPLAGTTNFSALFKGYTGNTIPMIDTSKITHMSNMFEGSTNLKTIPPLNTSNVEYASLMFYNCTSLEEIPLLDFSSMVRLDSMFYKCTNLTSVGGFSNYGKAFTWKTVGFSNYTLTLSDCNKLTYDSLMSIMNGLYDLNLSYDVANGGTLYRQKVVLGSENLAKLQSTEEGLQVLAEADTKGWDVT